MRIMKPDLPCAFCLLENAVYHPEDMCPTCQEIEFRAREEFKAMISGKGRGGFKRLPGGGYMRSTH